MFRNSIALVHHCRNDIYPIASVIADYFGKCKNEEEIAIVFNIYKELILDKGVDEKLLHNCFIANSLDMLVHIKNCHAPSVSYLKFKSLNIDLTPWREVHTPDDHYCEILSDDYCINCGIEGYYTELTAMGLDCYCCRKPMCSFCISEEESELCVNCHD